MNENLQDLTLGRRIAHLRKAQGLTQDALSEQLSITPQAISKWENDQSCPDVMTLPRLSQLLQVSIDTLLTGVVTSQPTTPAKKPEELIVRMAITSEDGERVCINLPFTVFRLGARYGMITITSHETEVDFSSMSPSLAGVDFNTMVQMIESGVTGKLLELNDDGERFVIWTE